MVKGRSIFETPQDDGAHNNNRIIGEIRFAVKRAYLTSGYIRLRVGN